MISQKKLNLINLKKNKFSITYIIEKNTPINKIDILINNVLRKKIHSYLSLLKKQRLEVGILFLVSNQI